MKKVILSLLLAFLASLLLVRYVFYPTAAVVRPEFQKTATGSPKLIADTITKVGRQTFSRLTEIGALLPGSRATATIPPPWVFSDVMNPTNSPDRSGTTYPTSTWPTTPPYPTTINPSPTGYQSPTATAPTQQPPTAPSAQPTITPLPPAGNLTKEEQDTVDAINQRRREMGLSTLSVNFQLVAAARKHSKDMSSKGFCSHTGSDDSSPWTRAQEAGYNGRVHGETVGCGYASGQAVVDTWWKSPGHKAVLTYSGATVIGMGWWEKKQTAVVGY